MKLSPPTHHLLVSKIRQDSHHFCSEFGQIHLKKYFCFVYKVFKILISTREDHRRWTFCQYYFPAENLLIREVLLISHKSYLYWKRCKHKGWLNFSNKQRDITTRVFWTVWNKLPWIKQSCKLQCLSNTSYSLYFPYTVLLTKPEVRKCGDNARMFDTVFINRN